MAYDDEAQEPVLVVKEDYVNATTERNFGATGWEEPWTDDVGRLYRDNLSEYGRCVGHVYADFSGVTYAVGWVFHKRMEYEGRRNHSSKPTYLREVWVSFGLRQPNGGVLAYDVKRRRAVPLPA